MGNFFNSVAALVVKSKICLIIVVIGCLVLVTYTVAGIWSGREKISQMNHVYMPEKGMVGNDDERVFELRKQNAFDLCRLELAKSDSISLLIDLVDSMVTLDLKGVAVHKAKIVNFSKSALFNGLHPDAMLELMSKPMKVRNYYSSIVKELRIYKKAPKDTIEAAQQEAAKDTITASMPSFYFLGLNNDIQISFLHEFEKGHSYFPLIKKQKIDVFKAAKDSLVKLKLPEYVPAINIELAKSDATTIFRAIPHKAYVGIRF